MRPQSLSALIPFTAARWQELGRLPVPHRHSGNRSLHHRER
jgi:hypothetical protein